MNDDLVSIIIPVYNAEQFLEDTIRTVEEQTFTNWELIFINDCSKDNSINIIKQKQRENSKIKLINLQENSGAAVARNTGINDARGKYIAFLDADDLWEKEKLEKQIKFMKEKKCAFSFTGYEFADENGKGNGKVVKVPLKINYKQALKNTTIWTSTVIFDVEELGKELIQMPNVKRGQDTATWWKVLKKIDNAYGLDIVLSYYRRTSESLSANKFKALKRTWDLYRKVEHLNIFYSFYNFCFYVLNAVKRRI